MPDSIPNLWPDNLGGPSTVKSPLAILRRQAALLGERTQNIVTARVESRQVSGGQIFEHTFIVEAPALGYRIPVVDVRHGLVAYPAKVLETPVITGPWPPGVDPWQQQPQLSEPDFLARLGGVFGSPQVRGLISSYLAQSQADLPDELAATV